MDPITCDNCQNKFTPEETKEGLVICQGMVTATSALLAAALCPDCTEGVAVLKVVLRRDKDGVFRYDGYQPVEAMQRAFGR